MEILKPREVAEKLRVTVKTLQNWDKNGKLVAYRNASNRRYYTIEQINKFLCIPPKNEGEIIGK